MPRNAPKNKYCRENNPQRRQGFKRPGKLPALSAVRLKLFRKRLTKRATVLSFDARPLKKIKELAPNVRTGLLVNDLKSNPIADALAVRADELALRHTLLSCALAADVRAAGLSLSVWTVDRERDLKRMIALGVDRITTNYPDLLLELLKSPVSDPTSQGMIR